MKSNFIKVSAIIVFIALIVADVGIRYCCFYYQSLYPTTSQAVLVADTTPINALMMGTISSIFVQNGVSVKQGDLLYQLDGKRYQTALDNAEQQLTLLKQETAKQEKAVNVAQQLVEQRQTIVSQISKRNFQQAQTNTESEEAAKERLAAAQQQLEQAFQLFGRPGEGKAKIKIAADRVKQAKQLLAFSQNRTPVAGYINNLHMQIGQKVVEKQHLLDVIDPKNWWVEAIFNPRQLKRIQTQQPALIKINQNQMAGLVENINGKKVKIRILSPSAHFLPAIGSSAIVIINTTKLAATPSH